MRCIFRAGPRSRKALFSRPSDRSKNLGAYGNVAGASWKTSTWGPSTVTKATPQMDVDGIKERIKRLKEALQ